MFLLDAFLPNGFSLVPELLIGRLHVDQMVLEAVLNSQDAQARGNLRPLSMAQATPRVFWNVVRHGAVGPTVNFQQALATLVPEPQWTEFWQQLDIRERKLSKRAKEAEENERAIEEHFANDSD